MRAVDGTTTSHGKRSSAWRRPSLRRLAERKPPLPTGIARLDEFLSGGLRPAVVLALAGQTKVGKTVMLATISHNLEHRTPPVPHLLVTLEQSAEEIACLKLARRIGVRADALDALDDDTMDRFRALPRVSGACRVMHSPGATIEDIEAEATYHVRANGAAAVLVDYLQLTGGRQQRENDEQHMTRVAQDHGHSCVWLGVAVGSSGGEFRGGTPQ